MLLRLLFVLLIALNIAVAAWLLLGDSGTHAVESTDAGVPTLKLLTERPASTSTAATVAPVSMATAASVAQATATTAVTARTIVLTPATPASTRPVPAPSTTPDAVAAAKTPPVATKAATAATAATTAAVPATPPRRSFRCLAVGPFANQLDLRAARTAIASRAVRSRQRQEQTSESHGWRVFLPAQPTRDIALAQARRLEAKGIKDYFVVTAQGELQNSVALGLFHDPANARKRRDEVVAAGFPARMSERTETVPVWWLDVVVPDDASADVRRSVRNPAVSARPTGCF